MTLTASEVSSLTSLIEEWEISEYIFAGLVTIGCCGEFVAEFTNWLTGGIREHKERLAKYSTLLLISSLAFELVCLVPTNQLSGRIIGSLNEKAEEASASAKSFELKIGESNQKAEDAKATAKGFENNIAEANRAAEHERLERIKLEALIQPREEPRLQKTEDPGGGLPRTFKTRFTSTGYFIRVRFRRNGSRGRQIAATLLDVPQNAGVTFPVVGLVAFEEGVVVSGDKDAQSAVEVLVAH
jgi:hypothetical protein